MTGQEFRRASGGRIDRSTPLRFSFDGEAYTGFAGDTLASALLANVVRTVGHSTYLGRPRGVYSAGSEEPNALVRVGSPDAGVLAPMLPATQVELFDGLQANPVAGKAVLPTQQPSQDVVRNDKSYLHCDVLVVGGGPAGLAAAQAAGLTGARVVLLDESTEFGGDLLSDRALLDGAPATRWIDRTVDRLAAMPEVRLFSRTTAIGYYDHNYVVAVERSAPGSPSRQRLWHIRARRVVLATGAHERPIVFTDNDRPGIMLAGAARGYVNRYAVLPGRRAVVFTSVGSAYAAALDLHRAGVEVAALVDVRPESPDPTFEWPTLLRWHGIEVLRGRQVVGTEGPEQLTAVRIGRPDSARVRTIECDLLAVSGGWNPAVQLFCQSQGKLSYDESLAAFLPSTSAQAEQSAGAAHGVYGTVAGIADGFAVGAEAAVRAGFDAPLRQPLPHEELRATEAGVAFWSVPARDRAETERQFVDLYRDATVADIVRTTGAGMRSVEHVKRYTTIGTGGDQGKTSGVVTVGILADLLGRSPGDTGTTTARPPYTPVTIDAFAGRERGRLSDPIRVSALHDWHLANGAVFEDVGQWKRPWYFPRAGEDIESAVLRECRAARESVAMMDASTLGKIELHGPDVAEFLDRLYTNKMSTLKVGRCRYGMLCSADGMVFDDGVVTRLGDEHFYATTTTGNAAAVLDWMEEWLQTEWPDLQVFCTSVTDHWATVALAGPHARDVLAPLVPDLDVSAEGFGFMAAREVALDLGADTRPPARVFRVSFSGELAYEINVVAWYAVPLWEALLEAGRPYDITPYGTETMHVLRAEKGFPIVGQETDGTVTPQDLGMDWIVSKRKADFVGLRSQSRPDMVRADRLRMVGLLPDEPDVVLPEGTALVAAPDRSAANVGHVTSSYRSATLDRSFGLAMLRAGTDRAYAALPDRIVAVTVTEPVFYDPEGSRRDG